MAEDNIVFMDPKKVAYDLALARYEIDENRFHRGVWETIHQMRSLYDKKAVAVLHDITGRLVHVPYGEIFRDIEADLQKRLETGMVRVDFEEEPDGVVEAHIIPLKKSIKPKKPKNPNQPEIVRAMPVRKSPEEQAARRAELERIREKTRRNREEHLAHLRDHYGEDAAQAFQALAGWK